MNFSPILHTIIGLFRFFFVFSTRRPSGLVGNLHTCYCTPASAEVVSSTLTKVGFVYFFRNGKRGNVST